MRGTADLTWGIAFVSALLLGMRLPVSPINQWVIPKRIIASLIIFLAGGWIGSAVGPYGPFVAMGVIYVGLQLAGRLLNQESSVPQPLYSAAASDASQSASQPLSPLSPIDSATVVAAPKMNDAGVKRYIPPAAMAVALAALEYLTGLREEYGGGREYDWGHGVVSYVLETPARAWTGKHWLMLIATGTAAYFVVKSARTPK